MKIEPVTMMEDRKMNKKFQECVAYENDDIAKAYWNHCRTGVVTIVLDKDDKFIGVVGVKEYNKAMALGGGTLCVRNYKL